MSEELHEVRLSDRMTVKMRELNAWNMMQADSYLGESLQAILITKTYAICSLVEMNSEAVNPLSNKTEFMSVASRLSLLEMGALLSEFSKSFSPPDGEELKNV